MRVVAHLLIQHTFLQFISARSTNGGNSSELISKVLKQNAQL